LVQELAAQEDDARAALAMALLAAQARFVQHSRRMEFPLREFPGDLVHGALMVLQERGTEWARFAERQLRAEYDEGASRLGLIARAVTGMGELSPHALSINHAGVAIFTSALAMASGQDRNCVTLSFADEQLARLLLTLRVAGLQQREIEKQLLFLHPHHRLPDAFEQVPAERAAALLSAAGAQCVVA
jgi:hypothetical protein